MANVLVFGHQNPDNDAIMSAVVLSHQAIARSPPASWHHHTATTSHFGFAANLQHNNSCLLP